jgi:hypothetical protein
MIDHEMFEVCADMARAAMLYFMERIGARAVVPVTEQEPCLATTTVH